VIKRSSHVRIANWLTLASVLAMCATSALFGCEAAFAQAAPSLANDLLTRDNLTGDWGGRRKELEARGIKVGLQEQSEIWANASGGLRQGFWTNGLIIPSAAFDLEKLIGLKGGQFYAQGYQIHARGPSAALVGNQQLTSSLDATPAFRLYLLYYDQQLNDQLNIRIGQQGVNDEFMLNGSAALYLNSSFGFPDLAAQNLPNGGPNFPLSTLMVRAKVKLTNELTVMGAVFDGDPAGSGDGDPQRRNADGLKFRLKDPLLAVGEVSLALGQTPNANILPVTFKVGGWYHDGIFDDKSRDVSGASLAETNGIARRYRGNYALYALFDQTLWQQPGTKDGGITMFGLVTAGPDDRNRESAFVEGGLNWKGIFGRPNDIAGVAFAYAKTSDNLRRFGAETVAATGTGPRYKSAETVIEATYYYQVAPWFSIQPDVQYVFNPGAALDTVSPPAKLPTDALTFGIRSRIDF
jgi:porin